MITTLEEAVNAIYVIAALVIADGFFWRICLKDLERRIKRLERRD